MATAPSTTSEFLDLLCKSGLLSEARLEELGDLPEEPTQCAAALISKGVITKFQAKLLLNGRYKGFKLGSYYIREQIGQGGMGAVYQAEHETLKRRVALKVLTLPKEGNAALSIERFLREARSAAALDHPNIVRLHDVGKQADTHFIVMEYVDGQTLDQIVEKSGPISSSRAVEYVAQAAAGLQHACEKGFVHRDIKPANLMLCKDGTIKILDMGLARPTDTSKDQLTEVMDKGAIVGTADYISPEQAMNGTLDVRSDIYSLGATFFALVTGQPPFSGNTTQKLIQHQMKDAPSVATIDKTFPPGLSAVVAKMLAKKPEHRYQTPAEVITALAEWVPQGASARMVAAISNTDMAQSTEMQATLSEIASGTKRIGTRTRLNAAETVASRKLWFWIGLAAGVLILIGGTVAAMAMGKKDPEPEIVQQSVEAHKPPLPPAPKPPASAPKAPVVAAVPDAPKPVPVSVDSKLAKLPLLYQLDLSQQKSFVLRGRTTGMTKTWSQTALTGSGAMPAGWVAGTYSPDCEAEVLVDDVEGRLALGFHRVAGSNSMMVQTPRIDTATGKIHVSFEYMFAGDDCGLGIRFTQQAPAVKTAYDLANTLTAKRGEWKSFSKEFDLKGGTGGRFELHPRNSGSEVIWIRDVSIRQAGGPNDKPARDVPLYSQNFKNIKPASTRLSTTDKTATIKTIESSALPNTLHINQHRLGVVGDYCFADVEGVRAFGMQMVEGDYGVQIQTTCAEAVTIAKPGEVLRFRISYRHDGTGDGQMAIQLAKAPYTKYQITPLPPTGKSWNHAEFYFVRPNDSERYELIINCGNSGTGRVRAEGMFYIQTIEVAYGDAK